MNFYYSHCAILGLNHRLKLYNSATTVVAFIIMPAATNNYNVEALKGQAVTKQLQDAVDQITSRIGARIYDNALRYFGKEKYSIIPFSI